MNAPSEHLTVKAAAALAGVTPEAIRTWIRQHPHLATREPGARAYSVHSAKLLRLIEAKRELAAARSELSRG